MKFFSILTLSAGLSTGVNAQTSRNNSSLETSGDESATREPAPEVITNNDDKPVDSVEKPVNHTLTIDASDKSNFVFLDLKDGELVPSTEQGSWIFGVRRYIFKTPTGVNGQSIGGTYVAPGAGFAAFATCAGLKFSPDESITMLGYTIAANSLMTSEWYDYNEAGAVAPLDKFFAIAKDDQCLKVKIQSYLTGVYEIEYSEIK